MKKNIVIVFLLIIIILMGGTLYYLYQNQDKILEKNQKVENKVDKKDDEKQQINFDVKNKSIIQALRAEYSTIYISKEGNAFLTVDYNNNLNIKNIEHLKKIQQQYTSNTINGYCNTEEPELRKEVCEDNDNVKSIKLDTKNVIAAYEAIDGQDATSYHILFLKNDGTIDALNLGDIIWNNGEVIIQKNIGNLSNIATIVQSSSVGVPSGSKYSIAIEKDGTQHSLISVFNN